MPHQHLLLIATVGGSAEPIAAALAHWQPARALFFATEQTRKMVPHAVELAAEQPGRAPLPVGAYEIVTLASAEEIADAIRVMREAGDAETRRWRRRGADYGIVADITGGTKAMTAALALVARQWACTWSYVGGADRTKEGVGVVVSGSERVLDKDDPWDALGYRAVEEALLLFRRHAYASAAQILKDAGERVSESCSKAELRAFRVACEMLDDWDSFRPGPALTKLKELDKKRNDLRRCIGDAAAGAVLDTVDRHGAHLSALQEVTPSWAHVQELVANAERRAAQCRYDDAVARLYRATEAAAQVRLSIEHGISSTGAVPLDALTGELRERMTSRARNGAVKIGLQDAYQLLAERGDALGKAFQHEGLHGQKSPLASRNQSILAHGFQPASEATYSGLRMAVLALLRAVRIEESDLPRFPELPSP